MKFPVVVATILLASVACCAPTNEQGRELIVQKLTSSDQAELSPSETMELLEKLDENFYLAGQFRVGKLLAFGRDDQSACDKDALIGLRSQVQLAESAFNKLSNNLLAYLRACEKSKVTKCSQDLSGLGDPGASLDLVSIGNIDEIKLAIGKMPAKKLLSGELTKDALYRKCFKARDVLQPFELVRSGAHRYGLQEILEDERLAKWTNLYKKCDDILYAANPYDIRWT